MYQLIDLRTGRVVYTTHIHAVAWLLVTRCTWLALVQ